ncbi:17beta-estradiol 17-dehydrogenase / very-long-chain 3-oxoacyl-CoA reductase [Nematocida sp. LUAm3]|nr:17beta-estradiol 17-dehydrogenase / very-long-chain 3-oxoacyl-CoA reductase [Nematocida sp. LUAm3]KAI5174750.1 17beta-estradiol 17-dehydrogenase / very-long-chain 3-oxoacyl-CoA reductase [Nematocida sp. LUAm2]KAI5177839.1 17beta-estradiol 17-dehydrogenase / very-long-chain 3-oxoacyl-CoA reductase [Nematocida sp. LUAm1]
MNISCFTSKQLVMFIGYMVQGAFFMLLFKLSYFLFYLISHCILRRVRNIRILKELKGKWALITGATDGIGLSMAREMAAAGINLILVSRSQEKLEHVKEELQGMVSIKIVAIDFIGEVDFKKALSKVKSTNVDVLVNNVGAALHAPTLYRDYSDEDEHKIISVNVCNTLKLTREYMSWDRDPKRKKYILSVGSMLGSMPTPYQQVYSGTKAFLQVWSEAVASEEKMYHYELLLTGLVCTKLSGAKRPSFFTPTAEVYGKLCVWTFGTSQVTYPYIPHAIQGFGLSFLPRSLVGFVTSYIFKMLLARKAERDKRKKKQ